ncbi:MAG: hypothetical protein F4Z66_13355 [Gammaproteobacteria bacterium]|nr:hypothetical protein [Gammaproteobacteria bacterium]
MASIFQKVSEVLGKFPWRAVSRYFGEFAIVFVGIYLAFLLTDYQEELRERKVRVKFYEKLIREFDSLAGHLELEEQKLLKHLAIVEEIEKGNSVIIPVSDLIFAFRGGIVNAAFEGGNLEAIDSRILGAIVTGRPALETLDRSIEMFNQLTTELLPIQMADENCCYDEEGKLVPHLEWYARLTRQIYELNRLLQIIVRERAIPDLEQSKQALE